ncbi:MAG: hypothetical protein HQL51_11365 [Magnetococcales bacterium]|nr:hypothetical protein [Magnetococcales bacterium]
MNARTEHAHPFRAYTLWFLGVFVAVNVLFVGLSEYGVRRWVAPRSDVEIHIRLLQSRAEVAAVFGDSRVVNGIDPPPGVVNLGYPGDNLETTLDKLATWAAQHRAPRGLLELGPQQFSLLRLLSDQKELADDVLNRSHPTMQMFRPVFRRYLLEYWRSALTEPGRFFHPPQPVRQPNRPGVKADPDFQRMSQLPPAEQQRQSWLRLHLHAPMNDFAASKAMRRLEETLSSVREQGMAPCLATFPVSGVYADQAERFPAFAGVRAHLAALARRLDLPYVDAWRDFSDDLFSDPDHLNPDGAARLTPLILHRCWPDVFPPPP